MLDDGKVRMSKNYDNPSGIDLRVTSSPRYNDKGRLIGGVHIIRNDKIQEGGHHEQKNPEI
jgi:hypothetical protein